MICCHNTHTYEFSFTGNFIVFKLSYLVMPLCIYLTWIRQIIKSREVSGISLGFFYFSILGIARIHFWEFPILGKCFFRACRSLFTTISSVLMCPYAIFVFDVVYGVRRRFDFSILKMIMQTNYNNLWRLGV